MKSIIIILISIIGCISICTAQNNPASKNSVLYIVKYNSKIIKTEHFIIPPNDIEHISIPSKIEAEKVYGLIQQNVVIELTPKDYVKLLNLSKLFDQFNVNVQSRNLPILR